MELVDYVNELIQMSSLDTRQSLCSENCFRLIERWQIFVLAKGIGMEGTQSIILVAANRVAWFVSILCSDFINKF